MTGRSAAYHPRIGDAELARRLESAGAVLIEGPRACGKTETARRAAASEVLLDVDENARRAVEIDRPGAGVGGRHAVYSRACDAAVYHYRDNTGLEVDAVVEDRRGDWCAFEVKLGTGQIDAAAGTLLMLRDRVDAEKSAPPRALGVIVSSGYGYRRKDGVAVIPVAALGP